MTTFTLSLSFFLILLGAIADDKPYKPTDYFLLNCGTSAPSTSRDGRDWDGDATSKFSPPNTSTLSNQSTSSRQTSGIDPIPYTTARIFHSNFTYTFPTSPGPKFLRLYFNPSNYTPHNSNSFFFTVTASHYTLLTNFTPATTVVKEFIVTVKNNQILEVTFSPFQNYYSFINGIEVVSIPDDFYIRGNRNRIKLVGQITPFYIDDTTALENVYRLNVGGSEVGVTDDRGMFRNWVNDEEYIFGAESGFTPHREIPILYTTETPNYTAPDVVYTTSRTMGNNSLRYNLTWHFQVDTGFNYLLRMYFCEIQLEVWRVNQREFTIFVNNQTAEEICDVITWSKGRGIPVYRDYVVRIPPGSESKQDLWLAMHPHGMDRRNSPPEFYDAILNGLEIFKLSERNGNLASPNLEPVINQVSTVQKTARGRRSPIGAIVGGSIAGVVVVLSILGILVFRRRGEAKDTIATDAKSLWGPISYQSRSTKTNGSVLPSDICRGFSLDEIKLATDSFNDNFVIGSGGFGNVYKGYIDNGATAVAIKRLNASSNQGAREFETEIEMLSKLRHVHLVSLIGYCDENNEMALVYDYMEHGTLHNHLHKSTNTPLSWKKRLQICCGAARGLHYLHTGAKRTIIHRDVKTTNILLDEKWVAKVSDFGLSKLGPDDLSQTHISTLVKGSFGYIDPEYYRTQQLTEKSDVFSFGVVLFEVLCARPAVVPGLPKVQKNLAEWARNCYRKGIIDQIIDPHLTGEIAPESLVKFGEIAFACIREKGIERPGMNDVVWSLEFALQLQEAAEKAGTLLSDFGSPESNAPLLDHGNATTTDDEVVLVSTDYMSMSKSSDTSRTNTYASFTSQNVFSEIKNPSAQ